MDVHKLAVIDAMYSASVCTPNDISCRMKVIAGYRKRISTALELFGKMCESNCQLIHVIAAQVEEECELPSGVLTIAPGSRDYKGRS